MSLATSGIEETRQIGTRNSQLSASPNPFSSSTTLRSSSLLPPHSSLLLYDASGSLLRTLSAGANQTLDGSGLRPGVYLVRSGDQTLRLVKASH
jgi:hypothetical protein